MADAHDIDQDSETPVNPYSLLEAVNRSSDTAHMAWLIFLGVMAYIMIAVAGVTHKQLLLQTDVQLPVLGVPIPQVQFFQFAPVFLLLFHFGLISQLALLARKTHEFDIAVRHLEPGRRRSHPLRLELHNFFFVQGIAGPHRSLIMSLFLHAMTWLTLAILPVVLLLFIQFSFLPYHDSLITWSHRIVLVLDIVVLILIGAFLTRAETSFFQAFWRNSIAHPVSFAVTVLILAFVLFLSFAIATIPDRFLDRTVKRLIGDPHAAKPSSGYNPYLHGFAAAGMVWGNVDGALFGIFHRNLIVRDHDLVADKDVSPNEPSLPLRGRDLRYAKLDRTDLHQADLTGAILDGASLIGTNLANARLNCENESELLLGDGRAKGKCVSARNANLQGANLSGANMTGIDVSGTKLEKANLEKATLRQAVLQGADFSNANLRKADLTVGVLGQGAVFLLARFEGADLNGAQLQFADFSNAQLQAASLAHAQMQGAILRDADLTGAVLFKTGLQAADLTGATLKAADLREATVWLTVPPSLDKTGLADMRDIIVSAMPTQDVATLRATLRGIEDPRVRAAVVESLKVLLSSKGADWTTSQDYARWQGLIDAATRAAASQDDFRHGLTVFLEDQICKARWVDGSVAQGIARRAKSDRFAGDMPAIYLRLKTGGPSCVGAAAVDPDLLRELGTAVDVRAGR
ncbi:MAG: pentapeptide repeat-containing protein [Hyphomicrobiaceae bacterium]|nr:pentapeptide repeat-containing protein [Hyphomicrobiaceae bacterium]